MSKLAAGISSNLRSLRQALSLTQEQLAYKSGISLKHVQQIEQGTSLPGAEVLLKLRSVLGVSLDQLLIAPEELKKLQDEAKSISAPRSVAFVGDFLKHFSSLPPTLQKIVLALVFLDPAYLDTLEGKHRRDVLRVLSAHKTEP